MQADHSEHLRVIRVWAALAWADGVIASAEAAALKKVIELAELDEAAQAEALALLEEPVELAAEGLDELGLTAREGIYKAAVRLANVDLDLATEELALLERLRSALDIAQDRALELEAEVTT